MLSQSTTAIIFVLNGKQQQQQTVLPQPVAADGSSYLCLEAKAGMVWVNI